MPAAQSEDALLQRGQRARKVYLPVAGVQTGFLLNEHHTNVRADKWTTSEKADRSILRTKIHSSNCKKVKRLPAMTMCRWSKHSTCITNREKMARNYFLVECAPPLFIYSHIPHCFSCFIWRFVQPHWTYDLCECFLVLQYSVTVLCRVMKSYMGY